MTNKTQQNHETCAWCEYFDGGGLKRVEAARQGPAISGDCLSPSGARFEPMSDEKHPKCFVAIDAEDET